MRNFFKDKLWNNKSQAGIEYMILLGFVTFAVISILIMAYFYSDQIRDRLRLNQVESFASQLVNSAESVFFAGEPSKTTVRLYLPDGIKSIEIVSDAIIINTHLSSGDNLRAFDSNVPLQGTISISEGIKKLSVEAKEDYVLIS